MSDFRLKMCKITFFCFACANKGGAMFKGNFEYIYIYLYIYVYMIGQKRIDPL